LCDAVIMQYAHWTCLAANLTFLQLHTYVLCCL